MHIGIDASRAAVPHPTGTEQYSREIIEHLAPLVEQDRLTLYVNEWSDSGWRPPAGVGIRELPSSRGWTHARLSLEMLQAAPDVLFVPAHAVPLWHPRATVVTVHDLGYRRVPDSHPAASRVYRVWSTRFSARSATLIIAVSEATKQDLVELEGISSDRIRVVHHGVDSTLRPIDDVASVRDARARYGLPPQYFLYLGTLQPRKNLERLIQAHRKLLEFAPEAPALVLAGQAGWLAEPILRAARQGASADSVILPGYIDRDDLAAILSGAVAFVFPSLYEGFGMPVLEAMACGVPVMTSNVSSLPEVAGEAALLVDPYDEGSMCEALNRLADDADLRADLRRRGIERARGFSWDRAARETLAVLRESVNAIR
ncbi:MAG TPA: glycosyltransferase family 1 protein [Chloroflexota bacterium]|nr:glycosyltransferase family 1 protein [Chloroflexota bacterium]